MYLINATNGAVSTVATNATHIAVLGGVLYASVGADLVCFDGAAMVPTVATGELQFGFGKSKVRKVTLGTSSGVSTVVHAMDGVSFPKTERHTSDTDVEHATNAAYEARHHQFTVTFDEVLDYIDLNVVVATRQRGQNNA